MCHERFNHRNGYIHLARQVDKTRAGDTCHKQMKPCARQYKDEARNLTVFYNYMNY